ncbi:MULTISPECIES: hypothetical protein [Paenibacillus]|nr:MULTISPECIES: hypothetical protein [Paenibacillus]EJW15673.1 hypothetical protein PAV_7c00460 [Paenibacillus alvei DSM 29]MEC0083527.1 hypothetical protein [Paenibacillus alvei]
MRKKIEMFLMNRMETRAEKQSMKPKIVFGAKKLPEALKKDVK